MKKCWNFAFAYCLAGLAGGVFYREFTKYNGFTGQTALSVVHTHLLTLGMLVFLVLILMDKSFGITKHKRFSVFLGLYTSGMVVAVAGLITRGVCQVLEIPLSKGIDAAISGVSGIGHILLGTGLILLLAIIKKHLPKKERL